MLRHALELGQDLEPLRDVGLVLLLGLGGGRLLLQVGHRVLAEELTDEAVLARNALAALAFLREQGKTRSRGARGQLFLP